jgi:hypothetical protein
LSNYELQEIRVFGSLQHRADWSTKRNVLGKFIFLLSLARNALIVVIGTLISYYLRDKSPFQITGNVSGGFPPFRPPSFSTTVNGTEYDFSDIAKNYGVSFIFIPILSILEAVSIAKAFCNTFPRVQLFFDLSPFRQRTQTGRHPRNDCVGTLQHDWFLRRFDASHRFLHQKRREQRFRRQNNTRRSIYVTTPPPCDRVPHPFFLLRS